MPPEITTIHGTRCAVLECGSCGVWFTIPEIVYDTCVREGGYWHCPNGHCRGYQTGQEKRDADAVRRQRDRLLQDAARLEAELKTANERAAAAEESLKRTRRRVAAGVCPCCHRTFVNMARHMKSKHPNVVPLEQKTP